MTRICVSKLTIVVSDNGILLIGTSATNFGEILSKIHTFSFRKMHLKTTSVKWLPHCLGLSILHRTQSFWFIPILVSPADIKPAAKITKHRYDMGIYWPSTWFELCSFYFCEIRILRIGKNERTALQYPPPPPPPPSKLQLPASADPYLMIIVYSQECGARKKI